MLEGAGARGRVPGLLRPCSGQEAGRAQRALPMCLGLRPGGGGLARKRACGGVSDALGFLMRRALQTHGAEGGFVRGRPAHSWSVGLDFWC